MGLGRRLARSQGHAHADAVHGPPRPRHGRAMSARPLAPAAVAPDISSDFARDDAYELSTGFFLLVFHGLREQQRGWWRWRWQR
jgi:hypothetical protein